MIAKSEYSEALVDIAMLLEKQVSSFSRSQIIDVLELLNTSDDSNLPVLIVGKEGDLLFRYPDNHTECVTEEKLQEILDFDEFLRSGNLILSTKEAS